MERNTFYVPDIQKCSKKGNIFSLDKKIWEKIQKYGHDGTLLQKKCADKKARQHCSFDRSQKGTEHARYKNVPSKAIQA